MMYPAPSSPQKRKKSKYICKLGESLQLLSSCQFKPTYCGQISLYHQNLVALFGPSPQTLHFAFQAIHSQLITLQPINDSKLQ